MATGGFTDCRGRRWQLVLGAWVLDQVRRRLEWDLATLTRSESGLARLLYDPEELGRVLWILAERQALAVGVGEREFLAGLTADAIGQARAALLYAMLGLRGDAVAWASRKHLPALLEVIRCRAVVLAGHDWPGAAPD